jgi:hypothetical protein
MMASDSSGNKNIAFVKQAICERLLLKRQHGEHKHLPRCAKARQENAALNGE